MINFIPLIRYHQNVDRWEYMAQKLRKHSDHKQELIEIKFLEKKLEVIINRKWAYLTYKAVRGNRKQQETVKEQYRQKKFDHWLAEEARENECILLEEARDRQRERDWILSCEGTDNFNGTFLGSPWGYGHLLSDDEWLEAEFAERYFGAKYTYL